ncbi:MAG: hypothetical protein J6U49_07110 [Alistipes sp.]|nr:hypothetical protein [Alistipes sp.]
MALINCSICLSDIPADRIKLFDKNGKKYLSIVVADLREADEYGNTHSIYIAQTKEEREAREKRTYIGRGKEVSFKSSQPSIDEVAAMPPANFVDDLPF